MQSSQDGSPGGAFYHMKQKESGRRLTPLNTYHRHFLRPPPSSTETLHCYCRYTGVVTPMPKHHIVLREDFRSRQLVTACGTVGRGSKPDIENFWGQTDFYPVQCFCIPSSVEPRRHARIPPRNLLDY